MGAHNPRTLVAPPGSRLELWIVTKLGKGWSSTRIAKEAGIGRVTVARVLKQAGVAMLLIAVLVSAAHADDVVPHGWMMDDTRYKQDPDASGQRAGCCSSTHCQPAQPGELVRLPGGGVLHVPTGTSLPRQSKAIYLTADEERRPFACVTGAPPRLVCAAMEGEG